MEKNGPTKTETLLGGSNFEIRKRDGNMETIPVRQLAVREFQRYSELQGDEPGMIEMACGKDGDFVDALTPESHEALVAEIERINADFFQRWADRQRARVERLLPGMMGRKMEQLLNSPTSLPKSASNPG